MFVHTEIFVAIVFNVQFSFCFALTSDTLIKAGRLPNSFLSYNRNNNVKYEVIKFEAPHNEMKNCIQKVLWNELIIGVCGTLAVPSVIGICSYKVNVSYGKTFCFRYLMLGCLFFFSCVVRDWYVVGLIKESRREENLLWCV